MTSFLTLIRREWMQHRLGWLLLALVPLALALLLTAFGEIQIDDSDIQSAGAMLPALVAMVSVLASTTMVTGILVFTSLILLSGLPRRDHADRSVEFWMSLPTRESLSLGAPLLTHLVLVPAAAVLVGLLGGLLVSLVTVTRVTGVGSWFGLPWGDILPVLAALLLRVLVGLPLAALWLLPLVLLVMLATAWFRRWGIALLGVVLGLGNLVLHQAYGITFVTDILYEWVTQARQALMAATEGSVRIDSSDSLTSHLQALPGWLMGDLAQAIANLASLHLLGGLLFAAACFALLLDWRRRSL